MAGTVYKFRLGDYQAITLRCDSSVDGLRCRLRGRLGRVSWATQARVTKSQIEEFRSAVERVVATLTGTAVLDVHSDNRIWIRVSVDPYGAIVTEYDVSGDSGGLRQTGWHAGGAFVCWDRNYFKPFPSRTAAAG